MGEKNPTRDLPIYFAARVVWVIYGSGQVKLGFVGPNLQVKGPVKSFGVSKRWFYPWSHLGKFGLSIDKVKIKIVKKKK